MTDEKKEIDYGNDEDEVKSQGSSEMLYVPGTKEDYVSMIHSSSESDGWMRKYRDYDCFKKVLGDGKLHNYTAKTKIGEYVGSCICCEYPNYAFVATYYVRPEYRWKGIGTILFNRTIDDNVRRKNIGIYAPTKTSSLYDQRIGFNKYANWTLENLQVTNLNQSKLNPPEEKTLTLKDGREVDIKHIVAYDAKVSSVDREEFVKYWAVQRIDAVCKVLVNAKDEVIGYGCGRLLSLSGNPTFGPIYCDTDIGFVLLFKTLTTCFEEELKANNKINMRVPSIKLSTIQSLLNGAANFEIIDQQRIAQFTQFVPGHEVNKIYCVADVGIFV